MSVIERGYAVSPCRRFAGLLFCGLLALALFEPGRAAAQPPAQQPVQEIKQIRLTENQIQSFIAAYRQVWQIWFDADKQDLSEAQADAVAKQNGLAGYAEYADVWMNIQKIMAGIDRETKRFTDEDEWIKEQIKSLKEDKSIPEAEKREDLAALEADLKNAKPVQFKQNIALVLKYYDKLLKVFP
jgi:hypothetical protein